MVNEEEESKVNHVEDAWVYKGNQKRRKVSFKIVQAKRQYLLKLDGESDKSYDRVA